MRAYLLPITVGVVLLALLAAWAVNEQRQTEATALDALREEARAVSAALEGSLQANTRRGRFQQERFQNLMESIASSGDIRFVSLRQPKAWSVAAGTPPAEVAALTGEGARLDENAFVMWRTIHLQGCMQGPGRGHGMRRGHGRGMELLDTEAKGEQTLVVGMRVDRYLRTLNEAQRRVWVLLAVATLAVLGTLAAWAATLRGRTLAGRLDRARARAAHLEELSLAAAGLAHETKNPLNVVRGVAQQMALDDNLPKPARDRAGEIVEEADRATARLSDFLAYARSRPPKQEQIEAEALINRVAGLLRPDFESSGVCLALQTEPLPVRADGEQFQQVLVNLLLNAQVATPKGKSVTVRLAQNAAGAMLEVRDEGCGLPDDVRKRLFQPYVSGRPGGHGLGLAIVKRIVDSHGWQIAVESEAGKGTRFIISDVALAEGKAP